MPLGFATGVLGGPVIYLNFGVPLFIVMASLLERSGIAKDGRRGDPALVGMASLLRVRAFWSHAPLRSTMNARKLIA